MGLHPGPGGPKSQKGVPQASDQGKSASAPQAKLRFREEPENEQAGADWRAMALFVVVGTVASAVVFRAPPRDEIYEISPSFRGEVNKMFADFKQRKILKTVKLTLFAGCNLGIVAALRGGEFGFVELDRPLIHFRFYNNDFEIQRFDSQHLFITISDHYMSELERQAQVDR